MLRLSIGDCLLYIEQFVAILLATLFAVVVVVVVVIPHITVVVYPHFFLVLCCGFAFVHSTELKTGRVALAAFGSMVREARRRGRGQSADLRILDKLFIIIDLKLHSIFAKAFAVINLSKLQNIELVFVVSATNFHMY